MTISRRIVTLSLCAVTIAAAGGSAQTRSVTASSSPITARLVIPDDKVLPGVPFDMWVEISNPSDSSVGLGLCADMIVRPEGGSAFTVTFSGEGSPAFPTLLPEEAHRGKAIDYLVMRPHKRQVLTLPVLSELSGPAYFADHRLSPPGRYAIALRLDYCWPGFTTPQESLLPRDFLGAVTTTEAIVERIKPTGSDGAVWTRMQQLTGEKWVSVGWLSASNGNAGATVVRDILQNFRDSNYYPYALLASSFGATRAEDTRRRIDAVDQFPNSPILDLLQQDVLYGTLGSCGAKGNVFGRACERANAHLNASKRPTTRIRAFGREDIPDPPCPPEHDCEP